MNFSTLPLEEEEAFSRQLTLPVEDRCARPGQSVWNGSPRWFRSANIIDLWQHRTREEQHRMIDLAWSRWRHRCDGGPPWPP